MKNKLFFSKTPKETAVVLGLDPSVALEWELRLQVTEKIVDVFK